MKIKLIQRPKNNHGEPSSLLDLIRLKLRRSWWALSWGKREPKCKVGVYTNWRANCGLKACMNIPVIGDFSLWKGAVLIFALSFAGCTTAQLAQTRAIADPLVSAAVAGYAQTYGVPPTITTGVTGALQDSFWSMLALAQAKQPIAQGAAVPSVGAAVAAAASKSSTPTVTQLTTALTALGATK